MISDRQLKKLFFYNKKVKKKNQPLKLMKNLLTQKKPRKKINKLINKKLLKKLITNKEKN